MAPDAFWLWTQRVDTAPSLAALDAVARDLRKLREDDDQAALFLRCTLRRICLYRALGPDPQAVLDPALK
jgi:hypothetical protein